MVNEKWSSQKYDDAMLPHQFWKVRTEKRLDRYLPDDYKMDKNRVHAAVASEEGEEQKTPTKRKRLSGEGESSPAKKRASSGKKRGKKAAESGDEGEDEDEEMKSEADSESFSSPKAKKKRASGGSSSSKKKVMKDETPVRTRLSRGAKESQSSFDHCTRVEPRFGLNSS